MNTITPHVIVTQEDIDAGCKASPFNCPIARALHRALDAGPHNAVYVWGGGPEGVEVDLDGILYEGELPDTAAAFVLSFDRGLPVEPITFELTLKERVYL